jgi:hypothetical protein
MKLHMTKSVNIVWTIITTRLTLSCLFRLWMVRMDVYIVTLSDFYSYRLIGKLTAFLQFQLNQNVDCYSQRLLLYVLPSIWMVHLSHLILTLTHHIRKHLGY